MSDARLPLLFALLVGGPALASEPGEPQRASNSAPQDRTITSVTVRQSLIIRVPRLPTGVARPVAATAPLPPIRWVEKKTDKCVPAISLAAAIPGSNSVDLLLNGGRRLRARFDNKCPALDFYSGFYVKMNGDGKVCADRDSIRSRSGGECRIESFRALVPAR